MKSTLPQENSSWPNLVFASGRLKTNSIASKSGWPKRFFRYSSYLFKLNFSTSSTRTFHGANPICGMTSLLDIVTSADSTVALIVLSVLCVSVFFLAFFLALLGFLIFFLLDLDSLSGKIILTKFLITKFSIDWN